MISNFLCFPPNVLQNNGIHLKMFPPKPQKISASTARLLGCFSMSVNKNVKTPVQDHLKQIESEEGTFLNLGFWKLKEKLRPDSKDPPMAKKDKDGNLITSPEGIKNL